MSVAMAPRREALPADRTLQAWVTIFLQHGRYTVYDVAQAEALQRALAGRGVETRVVTRVTEMRVTVYTVERHD
jgi:hypothetical protein